MTDERTVQAPSDDWAWVEPGPNDSGGWEDDRVAIEQLRAEGRVVLEPGDGGCIEGVTGYVHRAEYMELLWIVQELKHTVGTLLDGHQRLGQDVDCGLGLLSTILPVRRDKHG